MTMQSHISVLLEESIEVLSIKPQGWYLDATFGRGGHSQAILRNLGEEGRLYALDRDPQAAEAAQKIDDKRFYFAKRPFGEMENAFSSIAEGSLDGILFDLGVSSPQLDQAERGFSFSKEGPLDMRMDPTIGMSARDWLLQTDEQTLAKVIRDLGGEPHTVAQRIAYAIMNVRERLTTTTDLADIVAQAMPKKFYKPGYHPATQTFQAIRMVVNDEIGEIQHGLEAAVKLLKVGGVLAVITFHGLEDALVKRFIRSKEGKELPAEIPLSEGRINQELKLISPVIKPSAQAVRENSRCRSARLRRAIKL
ncbi:16S rRNA (cytosine(1402)-N(4))-methyltransferase RsmH [Suttonella ornithocola]|uniref:Ribosomal RNA small subunit methyltransferase H n=1 Tax=Suttonella ornithocola TaxID=279832 RepID=A0A380MZB3_9GAMM|nr:16S rRNA (cytosine(1402)-N(4))-methyltransferase RsmH [Suttonella ornithocola]SUO97243.1 Ribosomal RNA small subunit methyltransferase H [Suttonella ornithocola]